MRIAVTGATGFVGQHVVYELLKSKYEIIISSSHPEKINDFNWPESLQIVEINIDNINAETDYFDKLKQPDVLLHLAWQGLPNYKEPFHTEKNLPAQYAFLKNMLQHGLRQLVVTGTCFEYGMKEGCLSENMQTAPANCYAIAKDGLRKRLEELQNEYSFDLKWVRLFYMYGKGQNPNALLSQLEEAIKRGDKIFNMSGGEQLRDYLPVEKVAEAIVKIALQNRVNGIINCCSGNPISVKQLVQDYLHSKKAEIKLNTGFYPYPDYEPMAFWGDNKKLKQIEKMSDPIVEFIEERKQRLTENGKNQKLKNAAKAFNEVSHSAQYSYNFSWMGRPIIQYPQDMIAMQEIIWDVKPDLIIETGIAHGGSLIYYASILELIGKGEVLGVDIDIREHNRSEIEKHPMFKRIKMLQGSSLDPGIITEVKKYTEGKQTILVSLDSNHTHEHVLQELQLYSPLVTTGSYLVVFDTIVEHLPEGYFAEKRPWGISNNPKTAVDEFLKEDDKFEIDTSIDNKLLISVAPGGYLKRVK